MAIKKQEFYEGAALHLLARSGEITAIRYEEPFFVVNNTLLVHLKYSTRGRSPWGFTFTEDEQVIHVKESSESNIIIGLICGSDGVAAFSYNDYLKVAAPRKSAIHIACYGQLGEHYEVSGPDGALKKKISPSYWQKILERRK